MDKETQKYYEENANLYFQKTKNLNMLSFQNQFLKLLPRTAKILDFGCGSGRDLKYFSENGLQAIGIEISVPLANIASKYSGCHVDAQDFMHIPYDSATFDGIWACASLLHYSEQEIKVAWQEMLRISKPGAIIFLSLKQGIGNFRDTNGRIFYYYNEEKIASIIGKQHSVYFESVSEDGTSWINVFIQLSTSTPCTVQQAIVFGNVFLQNIENATSEIRWFLEKLLQCSSSQLCLNKNKTLTKEQEEQLWYFFQHRIKNCPFAYLIGTQFFMDFEFTVNSSVLIPRPETALIVEYIREHYNNVKSILDIGTGSGCIVISLLKYIDFLKATAIDISSDALQIAQENAKNLQVAERIRFLQGDLFSPLSSDSFDIIVSNPPYISQEDYDHLMPDVKNYEPKIALLGGQDGLEFYRRILSQAKQYLKDNGIIALEIGYNQAESVPQLAQSLGWIVVDLINDFANIPRTVVLKKLSN